MAQGELFPGAVRARPQEVRVNGVRLGTTHYPGNGPGVKGLGFRNLDSGEARGAAAPSSLSPESSGLNPASGMECSKLAARALAPKLAQRQLEVYEAIRRAGPCGATVDEVQIALDFENPNSVRPRFTELEAKGLIRFDGRKRRGRAMGAKQGAWQRVAVATQS